MKSIFIKTRNFVALVLSALAIVSVVSCQKDKDEDTKPSPLAKDWVVTKIEGTIPSISIVYSFTQSGQFEYGVIIDEKQMSDLQKTFSGLTLSREGQELLASIAVGDLLVQGAGSYSVEFDEDGTAGTVTIVADPEKCAGEMKDEELAKSSRFHDFQDESMIFVGIASDGENTWDIEIEMKAASSLGINIGKHHSLKALLDSVVWEDEF